MIPRRYTLFVFIEISKIFLVALILFTGLIVLFGIVQKLVAERISLLAILSLIPYIVPISMQFTLPSSLLFAVCSVYGRLSADNEIMAMKAAGVPPIRVVGPTLVLGFLFSPFAVWMLELAASWGEPGIQRVIINQIEQVAYHNLRATHSYSSRSGFSIYVSDVQGHKLISPEITIQLNDGERSTISAESGELRFITEDDVLRVELQNAIVNVGTNAEGRFQFLSHDISLDKAARKGRSTDRPANVPMSSLPTLTKAQSLGMEKEAQLTATRILMASSIGRYDWLNSPAIYNANTQRVVSSERLARLQTEPWRRWASGFSCFCFVWMGVPLAIWYRTADYWYTFGVAFLPLLIIYYPLFMLGLEQAKDGNWPPYSVWMGNIAVLAVGAWFKHKVDYS